MTPSYLTPEGHQRLLEELDYLRTTKRQEVADRQGRSAAQVQGESVHPVPPLRTDEGILPEVRRLPHLLPRTGTAGRPARHRQVELVTRCEELET